MLVARVTIGPGRWSKRGRRRVWEAKGVQPVTIPPSLRNSPSLLRSKEGIHSRASCGSLSSWLGWSGWAGWSG